MLLSEMEIFYYVVKFKSFSKAAETLSVSKSFISKKISQLEKELNIALLIRNTRRLVLTEAGQHFYTYCDTIVREGDNAYAMMSKLQTKPSGALKISIPPALGLNIIAKILPQFLKLYPDIHVNIILESQLVNMIEDRYDLVLRSAKLEDSSLIAQKIFKFNNLLCASKNYLKNYGIPQTLVDLADHNFTAYSYSQNTQSIKFIKNKQEEKISIKVGFMSNQLELIKQMLLNDLYMGVLPEFMIANELKNGTLIHCLKDYQLPVNTVYAIYPEKKYMLSGLKIFIEMLKKYFDNFNKI